MKNSQKKKLENSLGVCEQELSEVKEAAARAQNQKKAFLDLRGPGQVDSSLNKASLGVQGCASSQKCEAREGKAIWQSVCLFCFEGWLRWL